MAMWLQGCPLGGTIEMAGGISFGKSERGYFLNRFLDQCL